MKTGGGSLWHVARDYTTHALIGGAILLLTGFVPEEFLAHTIRAANIPEGVLHLWSTGIDLRVAVVVIGMSIIVGDLVLRRRVMPHPAAASSSVPSSAIGAPAAASSTDGIATGLSSPISASAT